MSSWSLRAAFDYSRDVTAASSARPPRTRNPELHRRAILDAAAQAFGERGYNGATLRDIAARAGVSHGLVLRHFDGKDALFLAAVPGPRDLVDIASGPIATLPERLAAGYVRRMEAAGGTDPFVALLRSAGIDDNAAAGLLVAMQEAALQVYRRVLGVERAEAVVPFLGCLLIGVTFSRYVVGSGALAEMEADTLRRYLEAAIRGLLTAA